MLQFVLCFCLTLDLITRLGLMRSLKEETGISTHPAVSVLNSSLKKKNSKTDSKRNGQIY